MPSPSSRGRGGCLGRLAALLCGERARRAAPREPPSEADSEDEELRRLVHHGVLEHAADVRCALMEELRGVLARLETVKKSSTSSSRNKDEPTSPEANHRRPDRRWTFAEGSHSQMFGAHSLGTYDLLLNGGSIESVPCSYGSRASGRYASSGQNSDGAEESQSCASRASSKKSSLVRFESDVIDHEPHSDSDGGPSDINRRSSVSSRCSQEEENPLDQLLDAAEGSPMVVDPSPNSSGATAWRADALDVGDRRASNVAARRGSASVDSIIDLVVSERQKWAEERQSLEARVEELQQAQERLREERGAPSGSGSDPEKEALRKRLQELRELCKARSRFGAWVCERHSRESDDEDEETPRNSDKEALREQLASVAKELKEARREKKRVEAACSSKE